MKLWHGIFMKQAKSPDGKPIEDFLKANRLEREAYNRFLETHQVSCICVYWFLPRKVLVNQYVTRYPGTPMREQESGHVRFVVLQNHVISKSVHLVGEMVRATPTF